MISRPVASSPSMRRVVGHARSGRRAGMCIRGEAGSRELKETVGEGGVLVGGAQATESQFSGGVWSKSAAGAAENDDAGAVVHRAPTRVAGVPIDLGGTVFRLRRCRRCGFQFKDPPINGANLLACYAGAAPDHWEERPDPRKRRFDTLRTLLERHTPGQRILDVGCFNGAILGYLGDDWQRFGLEPARAAGGVGPRRRGARARRRTGDRHR